MRKQILILALLLFSNWCLAQNENTKNVIPQKSAKELLQDSTNYVKYTGQTDVKTWGAFRILHLPQIDESKLVFKNLYNEFIIKKKDGEYRLQNTKTSRYPFIELIFNYENEKVQLVKIKDGPEYFGKEVIEEMKSEIISDSSEEEILKTIAHLLHDFIDEKYKPKGDYSFTFSNKKKGWGVRLEKRGGVSFGELRNGKKDGIVTSIQPDGMIISGYWRDNLPNGFCKIRTEKYFTSGKFIHGRKDGKWKLKTFATGITITEIYKDGALVKQ